MRYVCVADAHGVWKYYLIPSFSFCIHTSMDRRRSSQRGTWAVASVSTPSVVRKLFQATLQHTAEHERCAEAWDLTWIGILNLSIKGQLSTFCSGVGLGGSEEVPSSAYKTIFSLVWLIQVLWGCSWHCTEIILIYYTRQRLFWKLLLQKTLFPHQQEGFSEIIKLVLC